MPYKSVQDLPKGVQNSLPEKAQEIYKEAFNNAWDQYEKPSDRRNENDSQEDVAHRVAWSAVKQKYSRIDGEWQRKE